MIRLLGMLAFAFMLFTPLTIAGQTSQSLEAINGDWYLLCDDNTNCAIRGLAQVEDLTEQMRALVLIDRLAVADAKWHIRIVFMENLSLDPLEAVLPNGLQVGSGVILDLEGGAGNPIRYLPQDNVPAVLDALAQEVDAITDEKNFAFATLPRGDIRQLMDMAQYEQRANAEATQNETQGGDDSRYFLNVFAPSIEDGGDAPLLGLPCGSATELGRQSWQFGDGEWLWVIDCFHAAKVLLRPRNAAIRRIELEDTAGNSPLPHSIAFDQVTGFLSVSYPRPEDLSNHWTPEIDCGTHNMWGWDGSDGFIPLTSRRMPFCRLIPTQFWPIEWEQPNWRIIGSLIDH